MAIILYISLCNCYLAEKLIPRLLHCVNSGSDKLQALAASALWALVYNNQKVRRTFIILYTVKPVFRGERTGLVVRALDSGSGDPGSILSRVGVLFP